MYTSSKKDLKERETDLEQALENYLFSLPFLIKLRDIFYVLKYITFIIYKYYIFKNIE